MEKLLMMRKLKRGKMKVIGNIDDDMDMDEKKRGTSNNFVPLYNELIVQTETCKMCLNLLT